MRIFESIILTVICLLSCVAVNTVQREHNENCLVLGSESDSGEGSELDLNAQISLEWSEAENGEYAVELVLQSTCGIAGFFGEVCYDENEFLYLSGGAGDNEMSFSSKNIGGCVKILIDGTKNSPGSCVLARLYFKRTAQGNGGMELRCDTGENALCFDENGEILPLSTELFGCVIKPPENEEKVNTVPVMKSLDMRLDGEYMVISFTVGSKDGAFASGIKLFVLDLEGGEGESLYVVGVMDNGSFSGEYKFIPYEKMAVTATAVAFDRKGELRGDRVTRVFDLCKDREACE